jgi:hypothetical protein
MIVMEMSSQPRPQRRPYAQPPPPRASSGPSPLSLLPASLLALRQACSRACAYSRSRRSPISRSRVRPSWTSSSTAARRAPLPVGAVQSLGPGPRKEQRLGCGAAGCWACRRATYRSRRGIPHSTSPMSGEHTTHKNTHTNKHTQTHSDSFLFRIPWTLVRSLAQVETRP